MPRPYDDGRSFAVVGRPLMTARLFAFSVALAALVGSGVSAQDIAQPRSVAINPLPAGVTAPKVIRQAEPQYTAEAMRAKIQGEVHLTVMIEPDGTVDQI